MAESPPPTYVTVEVTDRLVNVLDRLHGQEGCSTKRRDRFTVTRYELEALLALRKEIVRSLLKKDLHG